MKRIVAQLLVVVSAVALLAGCARTSGSVLHVSNKITIGLAIARTGWASPYGTQVERGAKLAADEINAAGGVHNRLIELKVEDNRSDATQAMISTISLSTRYRAISVIGPASDLLVDPSLGVPDVKQIPYLSVASGMTGLTLTNEDKVRPFVFRTLYGNQQQAKAMAKWASEHGVNKVVTLVQRGMLASADMAKSFAKAFPGEITARIEVDGGQTDFGPVLDGIGGAQYDALYLPLATNETADFVRQARERGIQAKMLGTMTCDVAEFQQRAGDVSQVFYTAPWTRAVKSNELFGHFANEFVQKYKDQKPDSYAAQGYDAVYLIAQAVKDAKPVSGIGVRDALAEITDYSGLSEISFDQNHFNAAAKVWVIEYDASGNQVHADEVQPG